MEDGPKPRGGRAKTALLALAVVAVIGAGAFLLGGPEEHATSDAAPSATLDAALADGTPVYVFIHSLT